MSPDDVPVPWCLGQYGCGAYVSSSFRGAFAPCTRPVRWAGLVLRLPQPPVEVWLAFACDDHRRRLDAPRPLLPRDEAVRADWRAREAAGRAGRPYEKPQPLATGAQARRLHDAALAWAQEHEDVSRGGPSPS